MSTLAKAQFIQDTSDNFNATIAKFSDFYLNKQKKSNHCQKRRQVKLIFQSFEKHSAYLSNTDSNLN